MSEGISLVNLEHLEQLCNWLKTGIIYDVSRLGVWYKSWRGVGSSFTQVRVMASESLQSAFQY